MKNSTDEELRLILDDNLSGSSELLKKLNGWFLRNYQFELPDQKIIEKISNKFSSFESITNYLTNLTQVIQQKDLESFNGFLESFENNSISVLEKLFENAFRVLKSFNSFITISNSSQLYYIFSKLFEYNSNISITVCESRPVFEGRIMASRLSKAGLTTSICTEAMMFNYMKECDCAVIGTDKVLKNGTVVNKVGSNLLAVTARYFNKPFYVIADKSKQSNNNLFSPADYPPEEIWEKDNDIKITNHYFEMIDSSLINELISE